MADSSPSDYQWQKTGPDVWSRDIDEVEEFYASIAQLYSGSGRSFFHITGHVSLVVEVSEDKGIADIDSKVAEALRKAWVRLRYEQPCIASQVVWSREQSKWKKVYRAPKNSDEVDAWVTETFKKVSVKMTGGEWANGDPPAPKMPTLFLICPPGDSFDGSPGEITARRDLVFRSPHDVLDGIGTLQMLQVLITYASYAYGMQQSNPETPLNSEASSLSPCFREAAGVTEPLTDKQQKLLEEIQALPPGDPGLQSMIFPFKAGQLLPGKHQRIARTLTKDQTERLLSACKHAGVTPTHAYHAAITTVMRDKQASTAQARRVQYVGYILRNERNGCQTPYNTPKYAVSVYHSVSGRPLVVELDKPAINETISQEKRNAEFLRVVSEMREFYTQVHKDPDHIALAPYLWAKSIPTLPERWAETDEQIPVPGPNQKPGVSISSMGLIDKIIDKNNGPLDVFDPWVTGEELTNGLGCFLGTFRGKLSFSVAYNDPWHDQDTVGAFLCRCEEVVFKGFGLI